MLSEKTEKLLDICRARNLKIATAESCTGGMISAALTEIAGSSDVFDRAFVTYSNEAKAELLAVPMDLIEQKGAVSQEVAIAMAEGAIENSNADLSVSVTGIAGPGGGTDDKPVGLVHIASSYNGATTLDYKYLFEGSRSEIRKQAVDKAIDLLILRLQT